MAEIINVSLDPKNGVTRTVGPAGSPPISEEVLKKSLLNKNESGTEETEVTVGGQKLSGTDNQTDKTVSVSKDKEPLPEEKVLENDPKFQAIAKREREFRAKEIQVKRMLSMRENELNQRVAKFEAESTEKLSALEGFSRLAEDAKKNPEPYLRHVFGDNWYDNAVQYKLNGRPIPELVQEQVETRLQSQIQELREEREQERLQFKREQEQARQASLLQADQENQAIIQDYFNETTNYVKAKPETFELIHMQGKPAFDLVNQYIDAQLAQKGILLSPQEAAEAVENYLTEQYKMYGKAKKFSSNNQKTEPEQSTNQTIDQRLVEVRPENPNKGAKTLTNQMTGGVSAYTTNKTEQDRVKRAMAAMEAAESSRK